MKTTIYFGFLFLLSGCIVAKYVIYPPIETGSLAQFNGHKPRIILAKFVAVQVKEGNYRGSNEYYPSSMISSWIYLRIKNNCDVIYPDSSRHYFSDTASVESQTLRAMMNDLLFSILSNPDSIQYWKCSTPIQNFDSTTYFYVPILIENMNNEDYKPQFYTLLVNSKGIIVYSQMIHKYFKTGMWAKDYRYFAGDTMDIMPFSEKGF